MRNLKERGNAGKEKHSRASTSFIVGMSGMVMILASARAMQVSQNQAEKRKKKDAWRKMTEKEGILIAECFP